MTPSEIDHTEARHLTDQQLTEQLARCERMFDQRGEHGGSPGEGWWERMDEIEHEQKRRAHGQFQGGKP